MSDENSSNVGRLTFLNSLLLMFIALKLTGYITWSWWYVLAPLWGPFVAICAFGLIFIIVAAIAKACEDGR